MSTIVEMQLENSPVIGYYNDRPVTAICSRTGQPNVQLVGSILYVPTPANIRMVNGQLRVNE